MAVIRDTGKTAFVKAVLTKNNQATAGDVNKAWKDAGNQGTISDSLVHKTRAAMNLTRGRGIGRKAGGGAPTTGQSAVKQSPGRPAASINNAHASTTSAAPRGGSASAGRVQVLHELETGIDRLIMQSAGIGGLGEFEEALRRARRVLVRTHEH